MRLKNLSSSFNFHLMLTLLVVCFSNSVFALQSPAQTTTLTPIVDGSVAPSMPIQTTSPPKAAVATPSLSGKITWSQLSAEQKAALTPLASEWDKMDALRQKKWLGVANKYTSMKPEEQQRVQERVRTWVKMTPEQRMAVRENFANTSKKSPEQKSAQWQQYQQLSDAEKIKLANEAKVKKSITTIQPESKRTTPALAPLKKGPPTPPPASAAASQASIQ